MEGVRGWVAGLVEERVELADGRTSCERVGDAGAEQADGENVVCRGGGEEGAHARAGAVGADEVGAGCGGAVGEGGGYGAGGGGVDVGDGFGPLWGLVGFR